MSDLAIDIIYLKYRINSNGISPSECLRGALVKAPMLVSVTAFLLYLAVCNDSDGKDNPAEMQNRRADIKKSNIRQTFGLKNKKKQTGR